MLFRSNKDNLAAATIALLCEFDPEFCNSPQSEDDRHVGCIHIQVGAMPKSRAGMRSGSVTTHLANTECAHDGATIGRTSADNLCIGCSPAERFQFTAEREDGIEICCKDL